MAAHSVESGGKTAYAGNAALEVRPVTLGAAARVSGERGPVVRDPVCRMLAGIRVYDRLLIRAAASGDGQDNERTQDHSPNRMICYR